MSPLFGRDDSSDKEERNRVENERIQAQVDEINNNLPPANKVHEIMFGEDSHDFYMILLERKYGIPLSVMQSEGHMISSQIPTRMDIVGRVTLSPAAMKRLQNKLNFFVNQYEEKYGEIVTEMPQGMQ